MSNKFLYFSLVVAMVFSSTTLWSLEANGVSTKQISYNETTANEVNDENLTYEQKENVKAIEEFNETELTDYKEDEEQVTTQGKTTMTFKAAANKIKSDAKEIDRAFDAAIDKLPFVSEDKKNAWKAGFSAYALGNYILNVTGTVDSVEEAIENYLTDELGMPDYIAQPLVKTVFFFVL
ncbi:hypothetical protein [Alteribacillus sp. HJP-4]|uniref:hypothetical protein n=1 Tax=Alteribacillus sp. HJP-4 TaxID=2775394 RepID=UPI0035CCCA09